jgi:hypothetical protein
MKNEDINSKLSQLKGLIEGLNNSIVRLINSSADMEMKLRSCVSPEELILIEKEITELINKYQNKESEK